MNVSHSILFYLQNTVNVCKLICFLSLQFKKNENII